eukprot:scpid33659/ scgid11011/ Uncharacterized protein C16orf73 homolog
MFGTQQSWPDGTELQAKPGSSSSAGLPASDGRTPISNLSGGVNDATLVGIVLAKQAVKSFMDKKNPGNERCCFTFTLRDSPVDYINITCWGSSQYINNLSKQFKLNDVVEVRNPQVSTKSNNPNEDKWRPSTPGAFQLSVNENHSAVALYSGWNLGEFSAFAHVPISNNSDYYTLGDIVLAGDRINQQMVNILAAVKKVQPVRQITTRGGQQMNCRDVTLFDSTIQSFQFTLWNDDLIELADSWSPHENVLFITSAKVAMNSYRNEMTASSGMKTIILSNPDTVDAHELYQFAQSQEVESGTSMDTTVISDEVFSIQEIEEAMMDKKRITGHLVAAITAVNIDDTADQRACLCRRCTSCNGKVQPPEGDCRNPKCQGGSTTQLDFNLQMTLADASGAMERCFLMMGVAADFLGCTAEQFSEADNASRTALKWQFLLEQVRVSFVAVPPTDRFGLATCRIASIQLACS